MKASKIARRYAKALVEICAESKNYAVIGKQLETFAGTYRSSDELQAVMTSPVVSLDDKREVLIKLFAKFLFAPTTRNFLLLLLDRGRLVEIEAISGAFNQMMDDLHGRVRATVMSPAPMERQDLVRIQAALQRLTQSTVLVDAKIDPTLIGGVVVQIGHTLLDGSVRTQLDQIQERLGA